ncbi:hypothetical protein HB779_23230 (plasmid) [Phyllobacterium sp. 628]|uniref:hypothetical protein n=1 Tax=Phyllobacterium sp. 628 TaxID=2718938 RepID=UPI00166240D6|nr:hypothetical protein [Phyllobacterium sp. 628]QND54812.1 hypothetical protein HB779_23230 [Phyllobacterium sp. 628]
MPFLIRSCLGLAMIILLPSITSAQETRAFAAPDGSYTYRYPAEFWIDTEFADGSGEPTGVTASTTGNGDVVFGLYSMPVREVKEVSASTAEAYVGQYVKDFSPNWKIKFKSYTMTTMFGRPAVDMRFDERILQRTRQRRIIATIVDGKDYFLMCLYRHDKADKFGPACELAVSTARLAQVQ